MSLAWIIKCYRDRKLDELTREQVVWAMKIGAGLGLRSQRLDDLSSVDRKKTVVLGKAPNYYTFAIDLEAGSHADHIGQLIEYAEQAEPGSRAYLIVEKLFAVCRAQPLPAPTRQRMWSEQSVGLLNDQLLALRNWRYPATKIVVNHSYTSIAFDEYDDKYHPVQLLCAFYLVDHLPNRANLHSLLSQPKIHYEDFSSVAVQPQRIEDYPYSLLRSRVESGTFRYKDWTARTVSLVQLEGSTIERQGGPPTTDKGGPTAGKGGPPTADKKDGIQYQLVQGSIQYDFDEEDSSSRGKRGSRSRGKRGSSPRGKQGSIPGGKRGSIPGGKRGSSPRDKRGSIQYDFDEDEDEDKEDSLLEHDSRVLPSPLPRRQSYGQRSTPDRFRSPSILDARGSSLVSSVTFDSIRAHYCRPTTEHAQLDPETNTVLNRGTYQIVASFPQFPTDEYVEAITRALTYSPSLTGTCGYGVNRTRKEILREGCGQLDLLDDDYGRQMAWIMDAIDRLRFSRRARMGRLRLTSGRSTYWMTGYEAERTGVHPLLYLVQNYDLDLLYEHYGHLSLDELAALPEVESLCKPHWFLAEVSRQIFGPRVFDAKRRKAFLERGYDLTLQIPGWYVDKYDRKLSMIEPPTIDGFVSKQIDRDANKGRFMADYSGRTQGSWMRRLMGQMEDSRLQS